MEAMEGVTSPTPARTIFERAAQEAGIEITASSFPTMTSQLESHDMQPVKSPQNDGNYPRRKADCLEALEGKVQQLFEEAFRAGWERNETAEVLLEIAERYASAVKSETGDGSS